MLLVKFCWIEKTKRYVGWTTLDNGVYYASGETLDLMLKNLHVTMKYRYNKDEVLVLESKPSGFSEIPIRVMTKNFITIAIKGGKKPKENKKKYRGMKLLDRETLERNLRKMRDEDVIINGVVDVERKQPVVMEEKPIQKLDKEYQYKIEEDGDEKKLVVFELVKVAEWKLAK